MSQKKPLAVKTRAQEWKERGSRVGGRDQGCLRAGIRDGRNSEQAKDCKSVPGSPILTKARVSKWQMGMHFIQPCVSLPCNF